MALTNRPAGSRNNITFQAPSDGLFVQILPLKLPATAQSRAQMAGLGEQRCLCSPTVPWLLLPELVAPFVILLNYEVFTFPIKSTSDVEP